mmetsp:Transcript_3002/g.10526  ORF Transcript_3002/g.10526 Transcript_3002/m.10526 type:complete len:251 (-) Transcript_3002:837-1589(-)
MESVSLSAQPYSSSNGRHANLCCNRQSALWHDRLQYRTRPQQEHRLNSCRRVSTRPQRGCEHEVVPGSNKLPHSPYQSRRNFCVLVLVRCFDAAVFAAAATCAAASMALVRVFMSFRFRNTSSTSAAAAEAATTATSIPTPFAWSIAAASCSSFFPNTASRSTPKPSCKQCPSSRFAATELNRMLPRTQSAAPASGSLSFRKPPLPLKCITANTWCASSLPSLAASASNSAPRVRLIALFSGVSLVTSTQ